MGVHGNQPGLAPTSTAITMSIEDISQRFWSPNYIIGPGSWTGPWDFFDNSLGSLSLVHHHQSTNVLFCHILHADSGRVLLKIPTPFLRWQDPQLSSVGRFLCRGKGIQPQTASTGSSGVYFSVQLPTFPTVNIHLNRSTPISLSPTAAAAITMKRTNPSYPFNHTIRPKWSFRRPPPPKAQLSPWKHPPTSVWGDVWSSKRRWALHSIFDTQIHIPCKAMRQQQGENNMGGTSLFVLVSILTWFSYIVAGLAVTPPTSRVTPSCYTMLGTNIL
jgi:hypothetical protein